MKVLTLEHVLKMAEKRAESREEFMLAVRQVLNGFAMLAPAYEPFEHGTFFNQVGHELLEIRAELGDPIAEARRARRNKKISATARTRVYKRDGYACQRCGWKRSSDIEWREGEYRQGRFLTIDHVIPLSEGGPNHQSNMMTLCSRCNQEKGKELPCAS